MQYRSIFVAGAWALVLSSYAQVTLSGRVTDAQGIGLGYASVVLGDPGWAQQTDADGGFTWRAPSAGPLALHIAFMGYAPLDTVVQLTDGTNSMTFRLRQEAMQLRGVEVSALRAGDRSPYAHNTVSHEDLQRTNTGVDMPLLLDQLPSVVTTTDAGTGFGYSGIRIRGSDATRINVTINGVPLNDAESQAVYWVDLPDLATSTEDIEVQRGVGGSTNGPGAFGASINVRTTAVHKEPGASVSAFGGSYGTQRYTASLGTGLIGDHFTFDGRASTIQSDGYIDRASAKLKSYFLQGAWIGKRSALRFITFSGHETTYQAWNGVPAEVIDTDRTWNQFTYDDQVDDYTQTHYQLLFDQHLGKEADLNVTLFRVNGAGYYEELEQDLLGDPYGLGYPGRNDAITRKWLDNTLTGANLAVNVRHGRERFTFGGSYSDYRGEHYGEVIWARFSGESDIRHRFYDNTAKKTDANAFGKITYALTDRIDLFGDAQVRQVEHRFLGFDDALDNSDQTVRYTFFNPKAGVQWRVRKDLRAFASVAVANREPNRDDLDQTTPTSRPTSEHLMDYELGCAYAGGRLQVEVNGYHMAYRDQLVLTGELNDVGAALRTNVPNSFRQGIELQARMRITQRFSIAGNAAVSRNRIQDFTDHADDYDNGGQRATTFHGTDIAFSPDVIAGGEADLRVWNGHAHGHADLAWVVKYVGRQFLDNTMSTDRMLDPYLVNDVRANVTILGVKGTKGIDLNVTVRNVFSELYESNGWSYSYWENDMRVSGVGYYPQAPINLLAGITFRF